MSKTEKKEVETSRRIAARIVAVMLFMLFTLLLLETAARTYLHVKDDIPFFAPASRHILRYYPELEFVEREKHKQGENGLEILMLGASVLHNPNQDAALPLYAFLSANPKFKNKKIHIYNIAKSSQTTRDSFFKYEYLAARHRFDIVIVYHAINDTRANNCPPEMFRADYSHYSWYDELNFYHRYKAFFHAGTYIPYFIYIATRRIEARFDPEIYVPQSAPRPEWMRYGSDIKTALSFRRNIEAIADIAERRNQRLLLVTFAALLPKDYSLEKFKRSPRHKFAAPVELWGTPANVLRGISAHNRETRETAATHTKTALLDIDRIFLRRPEYFIDVCHFSDQGLNVFDYLLARKIAEITPPH